MFEHRLLHAVLEFLGKKGIDMKCRVAVIDSGINDYFVSKLEKLYPVPDNDYLDKNGHGTKCISFINNLAPEAEFISFKLLNERLQCTSDKLNEVLKTMLDMKVDIINLSLSTASDEGRQKLENICCQLAEQGKIVVASKANNGEKSYPAEFQSVIGVAGNQFTRNEEFWFDKKSSIQCIASRTPCVVEIGNRKYGVRI